MLTIYKYPVFFHTDFGLLMPKGAVVLSIQMQNNIPCMWVEVDNEEPEMEEKKFKMYFTGDRINSCLNLKYITTLQSGDYVCHFYESI